MVVYIQMGKFICAILSISILYFFICSMKTNEQNSFFYKLAKMCMDHSGNQPPWGCINTKEAICFGNESLNSYLFTISMKYFTRKF